jgi:hypothetical protein
VAAYRETFRRHRRLLSLPIILAVFIAGWAVLGSPKSYLSTADLWVDNPASTATSLGNENPTVIPPAQQEQTLITELLSTRNFALAVAHHSQLAHYLAHNSGDGWGPSGLFSAIGGSGSTTSRILSSLGTSQVLTAVAGPQVLQVSYRGPTPTVAASTLKGIINQLTQQSAQFSATHEQDTVAYYSAQVQAAAKALATARAQVSAYLRAHPSASNTDQTLDALNASETVASGSVTRATQNLNQASGSGQAGGGSSGSVVQEIDQPTVPTGPVSGRKKELLAIIGGLFAGGLITFLGLVALTPGKRDTDELAAEGAEGANSVGLVEPLVPPRPALPGTLEHSQLERKPALTRERSLIGAIGRLLAGPGDGRGWSRNGAEEPDPATPNGNGDAATDILSTWGTELAEPARVISNGGEEPAAEPAPVTSNGSDEPAELAPGTSIGSDGPARATPASESAGAAGATVASNGTAELHASDSASQENGAAPWDGARSGAPRSSQSALARARAARRPARLEEFIEVVRKHPGITIPKAARRMDVSRDTLYRVRDRALSAGHIRADGSRYFPVGSRREPTDSDDGQA